MDRNLPTPPSGRGGVATGFGSKEPVRGTNTASPTGREQSGGRSYQMRKLTDGTVPVLMIPPSTGVETGHTGRVPYAGHDPVMVPCDYPEVIGSVSLPPTGQGTVEQGHTGPVAQSGNTPFRFRTGSDGQGSAAAERQATCDAVRAIARAAGANPAETG